LSYELSALDVIIRDRKSHYTVPSDTHTHRQTDRQTRQRDDETAKERYFSEVEGADGVGG